MIGKSSGSNLSSPVIHSRRTSEQRKPTGITIAEATSWDPQTPVGSDKDRLENLSAEDMSSAADLYGIRLQMEEKRKRIEAEKRQMELMASRQREKVGKAAFLQVGLQSLAFLIELVSLCGKHLDNLGA